MRILVHGRDYVVLSIVAGRVDVQDTAVGSVVFMEPFDSRCTSGLVVVMVNFWHQWHRDSFLKVGRHILQHLIEILGVGWGSYPCEDFSTRWGFIETPDRYSSLRDEYCCPECYVGVMKA